MAKRVPLIDRLMRRTDKNGPYPKDKQLGRCWIWTGALDIGGYAKIGDPDHRIWKGHRVSYIDAFGPIPDGLVIDHLCSTRACVRPGHLEAVTNQENVRRAMAFRQIACSQGHPRTEKTIYVRPDGRGIDCIPCRARRNFEATERRRQKRSSSAGS